MRNVIHTLQNTFLLKSKIDTNEERNYRKHRHVCEQQGITAQMICLFGIAFGSERTLAKKKIIFCGK